MQKGPVDVLLWGFPRSLVGEVYAHPFSQISDTGWILQSWSWNTPLTIILLWFFRGFALPAYTCYDDVKKTYVCEAQCGLWEDLVVLGTIIVTSHLFPLWSERFVHVVTVLPRGC